MRQVSALICFGLLLFFVASLAVAQEGETVNRRTLWLGSHYTDFNDYNKKVGEYRLFSDDIFPEIKFSQFSINGSSLFKLEGHYFDYENADGNLTAIVGNRFKLESRYQSLTKQRGQDLLENMETREWLSTKPGGKIITHELTDPGADYSTHRQAITNRVNLLVSEKNNVRLIAAHRFIRESGEQQKIASNHCFSCHLSSSAAEVDKRTHQIEAGLEGRVNKYDVGYLFGYRKFKSQAPDAYAYFDKAQHPVNGSAATEFGSRLIFSDVTLPVGSLPETEKMSHKAKFKGDLGKGRFAAAITYSKAENKKVNYVGVRLKSEAYGGNLNYTMPLSLKARLIAKLSGNRIKNDDPFIDLPTWRDNLTWGVSGPEKDFDYVRYSSLDRKEIDGSAEVVTRVNPKTTVSILAGYDYTLRYNYPEFEADYTTKKMIGQFKLKYREGLKYTLSGKYRFEKTSDPFTSGRGLFEARGREALQIPHPGFRFVFYYEREALRYQDITTVPTDYHEFEFQSTLRPSNKANIMLGFKTIYDKNGDLDSLDVKSLSVQPNLNVTLTPNENWSMAGGYTFNYSKSRGPVTIALFDG